MGYTEKGFALSIVSDSIPVVQHQPEATQLARCVSSGAETRDERGAGAQSGLLISTYLSTDESEHTLVELDDNSYNEINLLDFPRWAHSPKAYNPEYYTDPVLERSFGFGAVYQTGVILKRNMPMGRVRGGGMRGEIRGFSRQSKARLAKKLVGLPWLQFANSQKGSVKGRAMFVTLTYPSVWPSEFQEWKRHLVTFVKRLRRRFADCALVLWKLEFQRRGAPHFHLIVLFHQVQSVYTVREWLASAWYEVVDSGDEKHLQAGTSADVVYLPVGGSSKLMAYLIKYMSKDTQANVNEATGEMMQCGRVWGMYGDITSGLLHTFSADFIAWCNLFEHLKLAMQGVKFFEGLSKLMRGRVLFFDGFDFLELAESAGVDFEVMP